MNARFVDGNRIEEGFYFHIRKLKCVSSIISYEDIGIYIFENSTVHTTEKGQTARKKKKKLLLITSPKMLYLINPNGC